MQFTLFAGETCMLVRKVQGAATICGHKVVVKPIKDLDSEGLTFKRYPAMATPSGLIPGSNAACRYIANTNTAFELYGRSVAEHAMIDAALDAINAEIETPVISASRGADAKKVTADLTAACEAMDKTLMNQTFLVGDRLSIADLCAAGAIVAAVERKLVDVTSYVALCRLINTVSGRCQWNFTVEPKVVEVAKPAGKENKKAEKQKTEKTEEVAEAPVAVKVRDPIEDLPPTEFDMDAWKRMYSNSKDLVGEAMPYLWQNLDRAGFTFWHLAYVRYNDKDNTKVFMASNLLGMFLQRIDNWLRKYMFGVCNVFEEDGFFGVEGVLMMRGTEVPKRLVEHDQYESFVWTKLDMEKDKKLITDYFCEAEAINGKVIADCKVYK